MQANNTKSNGLSRFWTSLVSKDYFGQSFSMKLGGSVKVPTVTGFLFSIFMPVILLSYSYQKFDTLINKKDAKIFETDLKFAIPESLVFNTTIGVKVAVAFTEWGDLETPSGPILDKSFGRIAFYRESYGFDANETFFYKYEELPTHYCTVDELNLEKSIKTEENVFFPMASRFEKDLK